MSPYVFAVAAVLLLAVSAAPARADDFDVVRARLFAEVIKGAEAADVVQARVTSLRADGTWEDVAYADRTAGAWKPNRHLDKMLGMARAYKTPGHPLHGNAALKEATLRAFDGWFTAVPKSDKNPFGTPESDNWWHNEFGAVTKLQNVCLLLGEELDEARFQKVLPVLRRAWTPGKPPVSARDLGDNLLVRTFLGMRLATLTKDADLMKKAVDTTTGELRFSVGEGVHADYSFRAHDMFYSLHYGLGYIIHPADTLLFVAGTKFAPSSDSLQILSEFILDGHQWLYRKGWMDYAAVGRAISEEKYQTTRAKRAVEGYNKLLALNPPRKGEIETFVKRVETDTDKGEPVGNRLFWRADFVSHQRPDYRVSVRMASKRIKAAELINRQGLLGYYTADGVTLLYREGPEYYNLMPVWDWSRLPGVTAQHTAELPLIVPDGNIDRGGHIFGVGDFVGGVSDGVYGAAAFDYSKNNVQARKGWFFFDREFVCLGAGIASDSANPIYTSVNQCHSKGSVDAKGATGARIQEIEGSLLLLKGERTVPATVHHDEVGYVFPSQTGTITLKNETQTGSWRRVHGEASDKPVSARVFSLWIDHGAKPQNAEYAYIVVPGISAKDLTAYAEKLPVRILANTRDLQAVQNGGVTSAIFYAPGTLSLPNGQIVRVDQPCALLIRETADRVFVSVSNPKQDALKVTVDVPFALATKTTAPDGPRTSRLVFDLAGGEAGGRTITEAYKKR